MAAPRAVVQYFLSPLLLAHGFLPALLANALYALAFSYYHYVNFLGYDGEPYCPRLAPSGSRQYQGRAEEALPAVAARTLRKDPHGPQSCLGLSRAEDHLLVVLGDTALDIGCLPMGGLPTVLLTVRLHCSAPFFGTVLLTMRLHCSAPFPGTDDLLLVPYWSHLASVSLW